MDKSSVFSLKTISMVKSCLDKPSVYRLKKNMDNENHNLYILWYNNGKIPTTCSFKMIKKKKAIDNHNF